MRGRYFEDFEIGETMESVGRTVTETDIVVFAGLSGDYNPLHTDAEFAQKTPFGQRVAHGLLGLAMASGLSMRLGFIEGTVEAFRELSWKFSRPVFIGDTIHALIEVVEKKALPRLGGGLVTFNVSLINQREEVVQHGPWVVWIKGRPKDEGDE
ncbi:MAG: MaoC/PaaZ C-terminal domain-containing protein [Anaerolineae bacterium]